MSISDISPSFRGSAYTRYKKLILAKKLTFYLEHGSTIIYFPNKGYWAIKHKEGTDIQALELQCLIHCAW